MRESKRIWANWERKEAICKIETAWGGQSKTRVTILLLASKANLGFVQRDMAGVGGKKATLVGKKST